MKLCIFHVFVTICIALNTELLDINKSTLSEQMKEFMAYVIHQNSHEKDGFLFILINKVDGEYSDFAMQVLNKNGSVIIVNFDKDKNTVPMLNPNHFKFVLTDPEGELSHAEASFRKVRASRAKIILILTREPLQFFISYLLNSYWKIKCINVIIVYEKEGRIEVVTMNPFLPSKKDRFVNLTATKYSVDLFEDKAKNLHQYKIRALLTYLDRTKIKRVGDKYTGKDYDAIQTIFSHLNGKLDIVNLEGFSRNPWYDSVDVANRSQLKSTILDDLSISILIKSETFTVNDGVVENIYPHTQNDIRALVPKSMEMSQFKVVATIFTAQAWIWYISTPLVTIAVLLLVQHFFRNLIEKQPLIFELWRAFVINNTARFPANKWKSILFLGALLYGFVINMFVQSKYTSLLATQHFDPDIDTAHQLFTSDIRLYALPSQIREMTKMYTGTCYESFLERLVPARMNEGQSDGVSYEINSTDEVYSFLTENDLATYHSKAVEYRSYGRRLYHLVKESIIPTFQSYKVIHGSPLLPMFENRLRKLAEGGFLELWTKRGIYEDTIKGLLYHEGSDNKGNDPKSFSLAVFKLPLYLLFFGYVVSIVAFLSELYIMRQRRPRFHFAN